MILAEFGTGQVLWSFFWFFLFCLWFALVVIVFRDIVRSELSGWAKATWLLGILILPYLGVILYLCVLDSRDHDPEPWPRTPLLELRGR